MLRSRLPTKWATVTKARETSKKRTECVYKKVLPDAERLTSLKRKSFNLDLKILIRFAQELKSHRPLEIVFHPEALLLLLSLSLEHNNARTSKSFPLVPA
jgi:hypothetical protein